MTTALRVSSVQWGSPACSSNMPADVRQAVGTSDAEQAQAIAHAIQYTCVDLDQDLLSCSRVDIMHCSAFILQCTRVQLQQGSGTAFLCTGMPSKP